MGNTTIGSSAVKKQVYYPAILLALTCLVGCARETTGEAALAGGVTGAAVGAGTGAIIGASISNGSVAKSALVGGAVGIPVGIAAGIAVNEVSKANVRAEYRAAMRTNQHAIANNQREIDRLREELSRESAGIHVDDSYAGRAYDGPTVGDPRR